MPDPPYRRWLARVLYPVHWSFLLGQLALWSLVLLGLTGVYLAVFYRPGTEPVVYDGAAALYAGAELPRAFASTLRLSVDVPAGEVVRRVHRVATYVFLAAAVAHLARVLLTGAFRRPRRLNYLLGVGLLLVGVAVAYTGHLLPYDMVAGAGLQIAFTLLTSIPLVGEQLAVLAFGGDSPAAPPVIVRAWALHVFVLPVVVLAGVALHLVLVGRQRHTRLPADAGPRPVVVHSPVRSSLVLGLVTTSVLLASSVLVPWSAVRLAGPFRNGASMNNLETDWYMFWTQGALRILPAMPLEIGPVVLSNPLVAGVLLPGLVVLVAALYPWLDPRWRRHRAADPHVVQHPAAEPVRLAVVTGWFTLLGVLSLGSANTVIADLLEVPVSAVVVVLRVALVVLPVAAAVLAWWAARRFGPSARVPGPEARHASPARGGR